MRASRVFGASPAFRLGIAVLATALLNAVNPALAQQSGPPEARVVVIGEGSVAVPPDYAQFTTGITTRAKTTKEATDANTKVMAAVTAALLNSGVAQNDIQTSRFSLQPVYAQQSNAPAKLSGFDVSNQVRVTIRQIAKLGDILDRVVTAGATDIGSVEFLHADSAKALDQAREAAVADARRKADLYAHATGMTIGRVAWITEDTAQAPPMPMGGMRAMAAAAPVLVTAGEDTLRVRITVGYGIAP
jgi:uncharacterized protein YggE